MARENFKSTKRLKELKRQEKRQLKAELIKLKTQLCEAVKRLKLESGQDDLGGEQ